MSLWCRSGQALTEYGLLLALAVAVIVGMSMYAKRGIQGALKTAADQMTPFPGADPTGARAQAEGMRHEAGDPDRDAARRPIFTPGATLARESASTASVNRTIQEGEIAGGGYTRTYVQDQTSSTGALPGRGAGAVSYSETLVEVKP